MAMDLIDKKLYEMGFTIQDKGSWDINYIRRVFDFDEKLGKKDTGYCQIVTLKMIHARNGRINGLISSYLTGEACSWGSHHCSEALTFSEMRLFYRKLRLLVVIWKVKMAILGVKRRVFAHE